MPGIVWFLSLVVIGIGIAVFTICKKKNVARLISFYLFAAMAADTCEFVVMIILDSYKYKPGFSSDFIAENILGHVLPNSTLWPATAILVAAFSLRYRWILVIAFLYMLIDVLFVRLGIYEHIWWQTWMTGIGIFCYCVLMKILYPILDDKRHKFLRYIQFSLMLFAIILTLTVLTQITNNELINIGLFQNKYKDSIIPTYLDSAVLSFISVFFICVLKKWYWKLVPFLISSANIFILHATGILIFSVGWNIYYTILLNAACLLAFITLERKYSYR